MGREDKAGHNHQESFQAVQANSGRSNGPLFLLVIEFSQSHIACSDLARHRECDLRHARNMLVPPLRKLVGVLPRVGKCSWNTIYDTQHAGATASETCGCSLKCWKILLAACHSSSCATKSGLRLPAFSGTTRPGICAITIGSGYLFGDVSSIVTRSGHGSAYDPRQRSQHAPCLQTNNLDEP